LKYMRQGVRDEADKMSFLQRLWWDSPAGQAVGLARAAWGMLRGEDGKGEA
jgi:hypothetical protein